MYFPSMGVIDPDGAGDDDDIESSRHSTSKKQTRLSDVEVNLSMIITTFNHNEFLN